MNFPVCFTFFFVLLFPILVQAQQPTSRVQQHEEAVLTQADQLQEDFANLVWRFEEAVELQDEKSVNAMLPDMRILMEKAIEAQELRVDRLKKEMAAAKKQGSPVLIEATQTLVEQRKILTALEDEKTSFFSTNKKQGSGILLLKTFQGTL